MIHEIAEGLIKLMLVKFMMNEVPHAAGIIGASYPWVPAAWNRLNQYAISQRIQFFSPNEGYLATLERRMPIDDIKGGPLSENVLHFMNIYKTLTMHRLPNIKLPPKSAIEKIRVFMAGYHLIAIGEASNEVVDDVYYLLKKPFLKFHNDYETERRKAASLEDESYVIQWMKDLKTASSLFIDGSRADKVIAIDAVAHMLHEYEPRPVIEDLFIADLESVTFTPIGVVLAQMFDIWFGLDPRRGITFADYIEGEM